MPNNGIISKFANLPTEFKADSTAEFNTATDTIVVNKALDSGSKISQKAITLDQLSDVVGVPYKSIILKIKSNAGGNFSSLPVFFISTEIYDDSELTYSVGTSQIPSNVSPQCIVPINFTSTFTTNKIYATGISNSAGVPLDIIASVFDTDTINFHIRKMDDNTAITVPSNFQFTVEIRIYN